MQKLRLVSSSWPTARTWHRSEICHQNTWANLACWCLV